MLAVTCATGQLGRLVIDELLAVTAPTQVVAVARSPRRAADIASRGVEVRRGDYEDFDSLTAAFAGIDHLLLISSNEYGERLQQHLNAIAAAKQAGVKSIVYTSVLRANESPLWIAKEHRGTEDMLRDSALPHVVLRNGWYTENYLISIPAALRHGTLFGAASDGRIASAARADYAAAAARVLASADAHAGRVYELAGDYAYTLAGFAEEIGRQAGTAIEYRNTPEGEFRRALGRSGLSQQIASIIADVDARAAEGALFDDGGQLSQLIGRPTRPWQEQVAETVRASGVGGRQTADQSA